MDTSESGFCSSESNAVSPVQKESTKMSSLKDTHVNSEGNKTVGFQLENDISDKQDSESHNIDDNVKRPYSVATDNSERPYSSLTENTDRPYSRLTQNTDIPDPLKVIIKDASDSREKFADEINHRSVSAANVIEDVLDSGIDGKESKKSNVLHDDSRVTMNTELAEDVPLNISDNEDNPEDDFNIDTVAQQNAEAMQDLSVRLRNQKNKSLTEFRATSSGILGRMNTPASLYTDLTDISRPSNPNQETKEAVFQQAIDLMSERCTSQQQQAQLSLVYSTTGQIPGRLSRTNTIASIRSTSRGPSPQKYFYVNQKKPSPMEPLKAWRGFHGNVYFEPISINEAKIKTKDDILSPRTPANPSKELQEVLSKSSRFNANRRARTARSLPSDLGDNPHEQPSDTRSVKSRASSSRSNKSSVSSKRQMVVLDKRTVFGRPNDNIEEDIEWIVGQESTGSLCVNPNPTTKHIKRRPTTNTSKDRVYKGSVAHRLYTLRNSGYAPLGVTGDPLQQKALPSVLLRTQTQYSNSSTRLRVNSPLNSSERFPPLRQSNDSLGSSAPSYSSYTKRHLADFQIHNRTHRVK